MDDGEDCRVYWGSHGCYLPRGHDGPHLCECAFSGNAGNDPRGDNIEAALNVGAPPYYGAGTNFYGEDAA